MNPTSAQTQPTATPAKGSPRHRRPLWRRLVPGAFVLGAVALLAYGFMPKPVVVETGAVSRGPLVVTVQEEGKTRIRQRHVVTAPVSGFLNRTPLRAGALVKAGETLLTTLDGDLPGIMGERTLAMAEANEKAAAATLELRRSEAARVRDALALARRDFERTDALLASGAVSRQIWDQAGNRVSGFVIEAEAADRAIAVAEAQLAQARAALIQTRSLAPDGKGSLAITAPVDGCVLRVYEENARPVAAGTPLFEVGDPADIEVEVELFSKDAVNVQPGARVEFLYWGKDKPLEGRVTVVERGGFMKVSALGVEEQRVIVRADFIGDPGLRKGLGDRFQVEARLVTWSSDDVLKVPVGALFRRGMDWMVYVDDAGRARQRKVAIGHENGAEAEVLDGLSAGDRVILHPTDRVSEGRRIKEL